LHGEESRAVFSAIGGVESRAGVDPAPADGLSVWIGAAVSRMISLAPAGVMPASVER